MGDKPPELYGLNPKEISRRCRVDPKTATRWKDGTTCPPATALMILAGDLGCFSEDWRGWIVKADALISPEGWEITVNDVLASPLLRAQLATYQAELRAMRENTDGMDEQPEPGELPQIISNTG